MSDQHTMLLFVPLAAIAQAERLTQALQAIPGVIAVSFPPPVEATPTIEGEVRVAYDPGRTNEVILEQALAAQGFLVLQAHDDMARHDH